MNERNDGSSINMPQVRVGCITSGTSGMSGAKKVGGGENKLGKGEGGGQAEPPRNERSFSTAERGKGSGFRRFVPYSSAERVLTDALTHGVFCSIRQRMRVRGGPCGNPVGLWMLTPQNRVHREGGKETEYRTNRLAERTVLFHERLLAVKVSTGTRGIR